MATERGDRKSSSTRDGEGTTCCCSSEINELRQVLRDIHLELKRMNNRNQTRRGFDIGHNIKPKGL